MAAPRAKLFLAPTPLTPSTGLERQQVLFFQSSVCLFFFGHRPKFFLNDRKKMQVISAKMSENIGE